MRTVNIACTSKEKSYYISLLILLSKLLRKIQRHHFSRKEGGGCRNVNRGRRREEVRLKLNGCGKGGGGPNFQFFCGRYKLMTPSSSLQGLDN